MYKKAIIILGKHQYLVFPNKFIYVYNLKIKKKEEFKIKKILLVINNKNKFFLGNPFLNNFIINSVIIENLKNDKLIIFKKKRRKGYKKKKGYRQNITKLKILSIKKYGT